MFDGIQSMDSDANVLIFYPPVDSIQEFQVQTSNAPAAYGGSPYVINVSTRSGTNQFRGVVYEFVRNSAFDAKNYFDSHTNPIPPFHMNQFGGNGGGPVFLPHIFNGKDRLFFFGDYEGKRQNQSQTAISTVPIPAFLTGNFSALLPGTVLHVPGTTTPLPGNQVQAINATSANLIALYPAPNIPGAGIVNNYLYNGPLKNIINQGDARIDYRTAKANIFGRVSIEDAYTDSPGYLPAPAVGAGPSYPGTTSAPGKQVALGYGRSIGTTHYYQARLGFSRLVESITDEDQALGDIAQKLGIPNANAGNATGLTGIKISGTASVGDAGDGGLEKVNNNWELSQALSWSVQHHEFQFGIDLMSRRFAYFSPANPVGTYSFTGAYTGYGLADFLYGVPVRSELDVSKFFSMKRYQPSWYLQDNWALTPKLTLNLGFRDDLISPWLERANRLAGFVPVNGGELVVVGTAPYFGNAITQGRYTNFGPRFGFAYSIDSKTVFRGGAGIFYADLETNNSNPMAKNAPFNGSFIQTNSTNAAGYAAAIPISAGFPATRTTLFPTAGTAFNVFQRRYPNPSANEWNLNIQRQITRADVLTVGYVGQTGVHILANTNINQPIPGSTAVASRRPYPNLADGTEDCTCGNSVFSSLQATYRLQVSHSLDLLTAYTYGHSVDDTSGNSNLVAYQDPYDRALFRGNSDFDVRQDLALSWSYELPFGEGKLIARNAHGVAEEIVGGWKLNSIDSFQTGSPFTPVMVTSLLNAGSAVQWPNRIGSGKLSNPTPKAWFNTAAFVSPGAYNYGNSGRNILYGPGTKRGRSLNVQEFPLSTRTGSPL